MLLSFPLTSLTYHVVVAIAFGVRLKKSVTSSKVLIVTLCFIAFLWLIQATIQLAATKQVG